MMLQQVPWWILTSPHQQTTCALNGNGSARETRSVFLCAKVHGLSDREPRPRSMRTSSPNPALYPYPSHSQGSQEIHVGDISVPHHVRFQRCEHQTCKRGSHQSCGGKQRRPCQDAGGCATEPSIVREIAGRLPPQLNRPHIFRQSLQEQRRDKQGGEPQTGRRKATFDKFATE